MTALAELLSACRYAVVELLLLLSHEDRLLPKKLDMQVGATTTLSKSFYLPPNPLVVIRYDQVEGGEEACCGVGAAVELLS